MRLYAWGVLINNFSFAFCNYSRTLCNQVIVVTPYKTVCCHVQWFESWKTNDEICNLEHVLNAPPLNFCNNLTELFSKSFS